MATYQEEAGTVITYKDIKDFDKLVLQELFLSVEWSSADYPDKLVIAIANMETVYSAWDGEKLVGLIGAIDDSIMTAYIHYLLVRPDYQGKGIGKELVRLAKEKYKDFLKLLLIAYKEKIDFYEDCGFVKSDLACPMYITSMRT